MRLKNKGMEKLNSIVNYGISSGNTANKKQFSKILSQSKNTSWESNRILSRSVKEACPFSQRLLKIIEESD
jgi:hypothetical protein